jgi:hypothetical protein
MFYDLPTSVSARFYLVFPRTVRSEKAAQQNISTDLVRLDVLGRGASGLVYKSLHLGTLTMVAVKVIPVFESDKRAFQPPPTTPPLLLPPRRNYHHHHHHHRYTITTTIVIIIIITPAAATAKVAVHLLDRPPVRFV